MYCLDTSFLLDYFKERVILTDDLLDILSQSLAITPFSIFEIYQGIYRLKLKEPNFNFQKRELKLQEFLQNFEIFNFTDKAGKKTAEILNHLEKQGQIIGIIDIMIASTALVHNCTKIITNNQKHFKRIPSVQIQCYDLRKPKNK